MHLCAVSSHSDVKSTFLRELAKDALDQSTCRLGTKFVLKADRFAVTVFDLPNSHLLNAMLSFCIDSSRALFVYVVNTSLSQAEMEDDAAKWMANITSLFAVNGGAANVMIVGIIHDVGVTAKQRKKLENLAKTLTEEFGQKVNIHGILSWVANLLERDYDQTARIKQALFTLADGIIQVSATKCMS